MCEDEVFELASELKHLRGNSFKNPFADAVPRQTEYHCAFRFEGEPVEILFMLLVIETEGMARRYAGPENECVLDSEPVDMVIRAPGSRTWHTMLYFDDD
ncbi:unnamed protein product [Soboliphyme baturini]|uniref:CUB domain-containing protein n=1 Tax=Soboliphyme baturini TaxID=241478 RepID=A0A183IFV2_9BILA|nr:unnamed protein product [Soboliphyme baturini]